MSFYPSLSLPGLSWGFTALKKKPRVGGSMCTPGWKSCPRVQQPAAFYAERARHGVALIVTGGIAPAPLWGHTMAAARCSTMPAIWRTIAIPTRVHQEGGKSSHRSCHATAVTAAARAGGPSALQAPINRFTLHELTFTMIPDADRFCPLRLCAGANQRCDQWRRRGDGL